MIELRPYQKEAVEHALKQGRSVLVLPTGTGKTIIGAFFLKRLFESGKIKKALVLVPTRILVEQTYKVYRELGLDSEIIYGLIPKKKREMLWKKAKIAISTPETVHSDIDRVEVDAIVIDECHHAVGDDAYVKVLKVLECEYMLGLSAYIPERRRKDIESLIGNIREWSPEDVRPYVAEWIGEILETRFDHREMKIYEEIELRRNIATGGEKLVYTSALKYLSKDGALALKESLNRRNKLSKLLGDLRKEIFGLRDLHKLDHLFKALRIYEGFSKAIVFVERVIVARRIAEVLERKYDVTLVVGKRNGRKEMLEMAKRAEVVVSTSAGEEGLDLPVADLLVNWSNTSSPLRFIQRHGRIMRKAGRELKFVVYLVTPETIDTDDLISSIDRAKRIVDVNVDRDVLEELWRKSRRYRIVELLDRPMPAEWIRQVSGRTNAEVSSALKKALEEGDVVYIYTHLGRTYVRKDRLESLREFESFLNPKHIGKVKVKRGRRLRIIVGDYEKLLEELVKYLPLPKLEVTVMRKVGDIEEYDFRRYDFVIDSRELLKIVLKNALS